MQGRYPSAALALLLTLAAPSFAADVNPKNPADKFRVEVLQPAVKSGLQDDVVSGLKDKIAGAKSEPDDGWSSQELTVDKIIDFQGKFAAAKAAYNKGQGQPTPPDQLEALRGQIRDIVDRVGLKDKDGTLETTYMAQLAPLAAVNDATAQDVQQRMRVLEQKIPPGKRAQYSDSIAKFNAAAASGNWQDASTQFRSLYDNMKNDGSPDIKEAMGQANVIVRSMKPRPADSAVQFTANKSAFEGGLKINDNIPTPYSPDEVRKAEAGDAGKKFGIGIMATGAGAIGAVALGVLSVPAAPVILLGGVLIVGGAFAFAAFKDYKKQAQEKAPEDENPSE